MTEKICDFCGEPIAGGLQEHDFAQCAHNLKDKVTQLEAELEPFPMQNGPPINRKTADMIYRMYSTLYGTDQSLDRLAERGGFGWAEVEVITKRFVMQFGRNALEALGGER